MAEETAVTTEEEMSETKRAVYELGYHVVPTVSEREVPEHVSAVKSIIEKDGGTFIAEEFPTRITLAYPMVKASHGKQERYQGAYFGWIKFELPGENAAQLKEALDAKEHILRYLLIKTVREDTRIPKRILMPKAEAPRAKPIEAPLRREEKSGPVSEEELDRTIEKLVVE